MNKLFQSIQKTAIILLLSSILLTACTQPTPEFDNTIYTKVTQPQLTAGEAIPFPTYEPMLTITGKIGVTNQDNMIFMDLATIESVGLVEFDVMDPFDDRQIIYRGVLMTDLLELWQVPADATVLDVVALNDYQIEVPISALKTYPVIFALQADGEYMPISYKGPAMLVFPYDDYEFDQSIYDSYWVWQIKSIEIK